MKDQGFYNKIEYPLRHCSLFALLGYIREISFCDDFLSVSMEKNVSSFWCYVKNNSVFIDPLPAMCIALLVVSKNFSSVCKM